MSDTCDGNCKGKWYSFSPDDRSIICCKWCGKPCPAPLPPEVRRLVEEVDRANEITYDDMTELVEAAASVRRIYRSEP